MTKNTKREIENEIKRLIKQLKKYDDSESYPRDKVKGLEKIRGKLVSIGKPAVAQLTEVLNNYDTWSCFFAADALGEIGDEMAIRPLADALEEPELGEHAREAIKEFGSLCIPEVIRKVEYRIAHPQEKDVGTDLVTAHALRTIGEIRCDESIKFLNSLLDDYMSEMPDETFDPTKRDWKYRNVDLFHLLDCMVRQQDKRAIPHITKARDFFPEEYADHKVCQIAIGRTRKGRVEGYLPMEALEIAMPSGAIMDALSGGEYGWKDTLEDDYGEYLEDDDETWEHNNGFDYSDSEKGGSITKKRFSEVYQFKITLRGGKPPIWRRIQVPKTYTFWDLHVAIQDAMGWGDCHLHEFEIVQRSTGLEVNIGIPDEDFDRDVLPDWKQKIADYFSMENRSADYLYDFGDSWEHKIELEKILPKEKNVDYPICIKGKRACPPEDCGGIWGYKDFLEIITDPDHEEYQEMLEWVGGEFDPGHFDVEEVRFTDPDERRQMAFG